MTPQVPHLESSFELPLETLLDFIENTDYPQPITTITPERRNSTLLLQSDTDDDSVGDYTPTCQLRATVTEKRIYEDGNGAGGWSPPDEERDSELIEYACFKGSREDILQNTALQHPMFKVLCQLAEQATCGSLQAIVVDDNDDVESILIEDGESVASAVDIVRCGDHCDDSTTDDTPNWSENDYIQS